jgi:hypothetical protein
MNRKQRLAKKANTILLKRIVKKPGLPKGVKTSKEFNTLLKAVRACYTLTVVLIVVAEKPPKHLFYS